LARTDEAYKVLKPEVIPFISYPYEWSFGMLKDAGLMQLRIQRCALKHGMTLKDASAYNTQFYKGKAIFIDTLSFERYREGEPWVAYRQFCQHFLAPLALMGYKDIRLGKLSRVHLDGIPLDLASSLLPWRTWLVPSLLFHIHLHAWSQKRYADQGIKEDKEEKKAPQFSRTSFLGLLDGLKSGIRRLKWNPMKTDWANYYQETSDYTDEAAEHKKELVAQFLERVEPGTVWDLGANTGEYSRLASERGIETIAFDFDAGSVELNYQRVRDGKLRREKEKESHLLPLILDLTNPSPGIGWQNTERMSLLERGPADVVLALALVHHLAISNNLPFAHLADFFSKLCRTLIIEFVPKSDNKVQKLLSSRKDIFDKYHEEAFEAAFSQHFQILAAVKLAQSKRTLYLMSVRDDANRK
jgi:hypothetical protein